MTPKRPPGDAPRNPRSRLRSNTSSNRRRIVGCSAVSGPEIRVDADACPAAIREILFRAAQRSRVRVTLLASQLDRWLTQRAMR